jgi:LCP family protein required for cell wall assembly
MRVLGGISLTILTASGLGHVALEGMSKRISRVDAFGGMNDRPGETRGTNFLVVGTDSRDGLSRMEKRRFHLGGEPCHCTDTIMLAHLSENRSRVSVVSLPRDSYAELPYVERPAAKRPGAAATPTPTRAPRPTPTATPTPASAGSAGTRPPGDGRLRPAKLNAAYAQGGPKLTVRTVERLTGVHIDHYLEIDFVSFMRTVDLLGGVRVCTAHPLKDPYTGLSLPAGGSTLNGGQALQYVRSRHLDGAADLSRMRRQQRFLAQVIGRATSSGLLASPVKLGQVADAVLGSVRADQGFRPDDLIALARGMRGLRPGSSEFTTVPIGQVDHMVKDVGSTVKWDDAKAARLWSAIREDRPLADRHGGAAGRPAKKVDVSPAAIRVQIDNGSGVAGLGRRTDQDLRGTGFATTGTPATASRHATRTVITYDPRWDRSARSLAAALPGAVLKPVKDQGGLMRVTLGTDFHGVTPVRAAAPSPSPDEGRPMTGAEVACDQWLGASDRVPRRRAGRAVL